MSLKAPEAPQVHVPIPSDNPAQSSVVKKKHSEKTQKADKIKQDLPASSDRFEPNNPAHKHNKTRAPQTAKNVPDNQHSVQPQALHILGIKVNDDDKMANSQALIAEQKLLDLAEQRVKSKSRHYAFAAGWMSPNPIILDNDKPDHKAVPGSREQHKDGYLCLDILYLAGIATPSIQVQAASEEEESPGLWYPPVLDWPDFAKNRSRLFNIVAVERMQGQGHKHRQRRLQKILPKAIAGDLIVGAFIADDGLSYGLAWLVLQSAQKGARSILALTANEQGAKIADFPHDHFLWSETLHVLRPLRFRDELSQHEQKLQAPAKRFS